VAGKTLVAETLDAVTQQPAFARSWIPAMNEHDADPSAWAFRVGEPAGIGHNIAQDCQGPNSIVGSIIG
jgi:hypothetical protein